MQEWYLGREKVPCLERCPQFRCVLIESSHCINCTLYSIMYIYVLRRYDKHREEILHGGIY